MARLMSSEELCDRLIAPGGLVIAGLALPWITKEYHGLWAWPVVIFGLITMTVGFWRQHCWPG